MHKSKRKWICEDCLDDTSKLKEHYYINDDIWYKIHPTESGMLCIGCVEVRLGRKLGPKDFPKVHINNFKLYPMSQRLLSRIRGS